jgi:DUF971 family protein
VSGSLDLVEFFLQCAAVADACNQRLKDETGEDSVFRLAAKTLRDTAPSWKIVSAQETQDVVVNGWAGVETMDLPPIDFSDDFWLNAPFNL